MHVLKKLTGVKREKIVLLFLQHFFGQNIEGGQQPCMCAATGAALNKGNLLQRCEAYLEDSSTPIRGLFDGG